MAIFMRHFEMQSERGALLPLIALLVVVIIAVVGLVLDLSRLEATIRRAQSAVDAAAIAGATPLETEALLSAQDEVDDWARIKRKVLLSIANGQMLGLNSAARSSLCMDPGTCSPTFRMDDASSPATTNDCSGYDRMRGSRGNLSVRVERKLYCYWKEPWADPTTAPVTRQVFSLENSSIHFCKANAVSVELGLSEIKTVFSTVMGFDQFSDVKVNATAYMEEPIPAIGSLCGSVNCDEIGIRDLMEAKGLIPSPQPTPWPGTPPPVITTTACPYVLPLPAPVCP